MTLPPYSRSNPQRPQFMDELAINWTGSPLFKAKYYVVLANGTPAKLAQLQSQTGVIDFPNVDLDINSALPVARQAKNAQIAQIVGIPIIPSETNGSFTNRAANAEGNIWDKNSLFVADP